MLDFLGWVGQPEAYNWITLIGALSAMATAGFTGYTASTQWRDRRQRIHVEWTLEGGNALRVTCDVSNKTNGTVEVERLIVSGPIKGLTLSDMKSHDKHESWGDNSCPVGRKLEAGGTRAFTFLASYDPSGLRSSASRPSSRSLAWATRLAWRLGFFRFESGVRLSMRLILRRISSPMRPIRKTHRIRIYAASAMHIADTIDASADKT